jgi:hypothetical protein
MSINGGFATRTLDETYNTQVYNLIYLLQYRIKRVYNSEVVSEKNFQKVLAKTYDKIKHMEAHKYTPPRFSEAMKDLADLILKDKDSNSASASRSANTRRTITHQEEVKSLQANPRKSSPTANPRKSPKAD